MNNHHDAALEVLTASREWIGHFNAGRVDECVRGYMPDAKLHAAPIGHFEGHASIHGFWKPFIESGATDLQYSNVEIRVESDARVRLKASWRMTVGRGVISNELWVREGETWRLAEDEFEVQEKYEG